MGSRREIERLIVQGRVFVDGRPAQLGQRLIGREKVVVDGREVDWRRAPGKVDVLAYYKPDGEITTRSDPEQRPTVFDAVPGPKDGGRWISIGRLDVSTSGLLLLTTDGTLAHRLMHPSYEIDREYAVRLLGQPTQEQCEQLERGVELEDGRARFKHLVRAGGSGSNVWYHATLTEGRNREIRRMFEAVGMAVSRLIRVRYGPIQLGVLHRGQTRRLTRNELRALYEAVGLESP